MSVKNVVAFNVAKYQYQYEHHEIQKLFNLRKLRSFDFWWFWSYRDFMWNRNPLSAKKKQNKNKKMPQVHGFFIRNSIFGINFRVA